MSTNVFLIYRPETLARSAEHFGVSVDNYASSLPAAGIQAVEIAHGGLTVVGPKIGYYSRAELKPGDMFRGAYDSSVRVDHDDDYDGSITAVIPDVVSDFSQKKNIPVLAVVRVGARLLQFAVTTETGLGRDLDVYAKRTSGNKGVLDSKLSFSISPINTIIVQRNRNTGLNRIRSRLPKH